MVTPRSAGEHVDRAPAFGHELVEIQIDRPKRITAGIGASEHEHVLNEAAQAPGLTADDRQRFAILRLRRDAPG